MSKKITLFPFDFDDECGLRPEDFGEVFKSNEDDDCFIISCLSHSVLKGKKIVMFYFFKKTARWQQKNVMYAGMYL